MSATTKLTQKNVNVTFEFNKTAKLEQMSLNQALKSVIISYDSEAGKKWAQKYNVKKSDLTIKNVIEFWHLMSCEDRLYYTKYVNGIKTECIKTKFTTYDIIRSMQKFADSKK